MYSTSNHIWTEAQFNELYDVLYNQGGYAELLTWNQYPSDRHLHVAY